MYIIFLLIHLTFSAIFYVFGKNFEASLFLLLGVVFFFAFFPFSFKKIFSTKPKPKHSDLHEIPTNSLKKTYKEFLSSGSYYFAFVSFYIAFFGISYSVAPLFSISFEAFYGISTFAVAFLIMTLFLLFRKNETIARIFYLNTYIFSLICVLFFLYIFVFHPKFNDLYLLINAFFSLFAFPFLFTIRFPFKKNSTLIPSFLAFFFFCVLYIVTQKLHLPLVSSILGILLFFAIFFFEILLKIPRLRPFREIGLQNSFLFLLFLLPFIGIYHFQNSFDLFLWIFIMIYTLFLAYIYKRFSVIFSGILAIFSLWYLYLGMFFPGTTPSSFVEYFIFLSIFPFAVIPLDRFFSHTHRTTEILFSVSIFHFVIFSSLSYFLFDTFPILWISFLFLWFSSLLFVTYIRFKKT